MSELDHSEPTKGRTLPGKYYTSDEIFAEERKRVLHSQWFCVGRKEELKADGEFFLADVAGDSIIVTRSEDQTSAFHNVCRHRGTQLVCDSTGEFPNCRIQCPYHRWTYDAKGQLIAAPHMDETPNYLHNSRSGRGSCSST
jgi:Rieske 2Fe-2S family protein